MKHIVLFVLASILFFFGCEGENGGIKTFFSKKMETTETSESQESEKTRYVKNWGVWFFKNEDDLGKELKEIKEKIYMEFGSKVFILDEKMVNERNYNKIRLPDTSEYWVNADVLIDQFVVITTNDVLCYKQPDTDYADTILLQPGDLGFFVKKIDGWVNADFITYRPTEPGGEHQRVGNKWINTGYTDDLRTAKEAYYLNLAYYYIYSGEKNQEKAIERLEKALNINVDTDTEITHIIKNLLNELESSAEKHPEGKVEIITLNPDEEEE